MIFYVTKKTRERLKIPLHNEIADELQGLVRTVLLRETDDIFKWGIKIFYFDSRKCLQVIHFASKLGIFLIDIKVQDIKTIGDRIIAYLSKIYEDDKKVLDLLSCFFKESCFAVFDALKDRSMIATLNRNESIFLDNGYELRRFIRDGILHSLEIIRKYNFMYYATKKVNGKSIYITPGEEFKKVLEERYGKKDS